MNATAKRWLAFLLCMVMCVTGATVSAPNAEAANMVNISSGSYSPGTLKEGQSYSISGNLTSKYKITSVTTGIYYSNGKALQTKTEYPNATSYNINRVDKYIRFGSLSVGSYVFKVTAAVKFGWFSLSSVVVNKSFTVVPKAIESTLKIGSGRYSPGTLTVGQSYSISAEITSNYRINSVTVGVYYTNGKAATTKSANPNAYSYNINKLDSSIRFGTLSVGSYIFKITARDATGKTVSKSSSFKVERPPFTYKGMALSVYESQGRQMCVLTSISMLIRSKLYLDGKPYSGITQYVVKNQYNNGNLPAYWGVICQNANKKSGASGTMTHKTLSGSATTRLATVLNLVSSRREGVVVYFYMNGNNQHAIRICNYDGAFYVSDPGSSNMRYVPISKSLIGNGHYAWKSNYWTYANRVVYYQ